MKWVYARGSSLVPFAVGAFVLSGFVWHLFAATPLDPMPLEPVGAVDLSSAREGGHARMRAGFILEGATTVLEALRAQPLDAVEQSREVESALQLLSFCMVVLMPDEMLVSFHDALDPTVHPIDALVDIEFYKEFQDYAKWRTVLTLDKAAFHAAVRSAAESDAAVVRLEGLRTLLNPAFNENPNDIAAMTAAMNAMALEFPDNPATREAFRNLMRGCSGRAFDHPEAVDMLLHALPWEPAMQSLLATDSVVAVVEEALSARTVTVKSETGVPVSDPRAAAVEVLATAAESHPDAEARDWCIRSMASTASVANETAADLTPTIGACLETVADREAAAGKSLTAALEPDVARAQFLLFANAIEEGDLAAAAPYIDVLWDQVRSQELPDINLYERIPRKFGYYAYALVGQTRKDEAIAFFERLATLYPNSYLAQDHLKTAAFLRRSAP